MNMSGLDRRNNGLDIPIASVEKKPEFTPRFYDKELVTPGTYNLTFSPDGTEGSKIVLRIGLPIEKLASISKLTDKLLSKCKNEIYVNENYLTKGTSRPDMYLSCDDSSGLFSFDTDLMNSEEFKKIFGVKPPRGENSVIQVYAEFLNEVAKAKFKLIQPPKLESIIAEAK